MKMQIFCMMSGFARSPVKSKLITFIADYIRTFTWDKKLEMVVKSTGILGGQGESKKYLYLV